MLDFDYSSHYAELIDAVDWKIELPADQSNFFSERGLVEQVNPQQQATQRRMVRTRGLMLMENDLPSMPRQRHWLGCYTKDFSRDGCGLVAPVQCFPDEVVRLVLPTFWLLLKVERCRRWNSSAYDVGFTLLQRNDPDRHAFIQNGRFLKLNRD